MHESARERHVGRGRVCVWRVVCVIERLSLGAGRPLLTSGGLQSALPNTLIIKTNEDTVPFF